MQEVGSMILDAFCRPMQVLLWTANCSKSTRFVILMGGTVFMCPALMGIAWATASNVRSATIGIGENDCLDWNSAGEPWIARIRIDPSMSVIGIPGNKIKFIQTLVQVNLCSLFLWKTYDIFVLSIPEGKRCFNWNLLEMIGRGNVTEKRALCIKELYIYSTKEAKKVPVVVVWAGKTIVRMWKNSWTMLMYT